MPYPGVSEEDTPKVERCVERVMQDGYDKSSAIAICVANIKGEANVMNAESMGITTPSTTGSVSNSHTISFEPQLPQNINGISFSEPDPGLYNALNKVMAELPPLGEIVHFRNAVIAKVERNANGDVIDLENALSLARTVAFTPLVDKHGEDAKVLGVYTQGEVKALTYDGVDGVYVVVGGLLYPRRNPTEVQEIMNGQRKQSVEAISEECECSVCGQKAQYINDYCEHLMPILAQKALPQDVSRKHYNMRAIGGAAVKNPAGTNTGFRGDGFLVIASKQQPIEENMDEKINEITQQLEAARADLEAKINEIAELQGRLDAVQAEKVAVEASMEAKANEHELTMARALGLVEAGMKPKDVKSVTGELAGWTEQTYNLFIASQKRPDQVVPQTPPAVDDPGDNAQNTLSALDMLGNV